MGGGLTVNVVQKAKDLLGMGEADEEAPKPPESAADSDE